MIINDEGDYGSVLTLTNIQESDSGDYKCNYRRSIVGTNPPEDGIFTIEVRGTVLCKIMRPPRFLIVFQI